MFFNHRGRKWGRGEGSKVHVQVCVCVLSVRCVLPWSTPWATASTWQRGLSSDGTSSDTAETDSGYYGNKTIRWQMKPLYKFPLKLHPQYYFHVIHTKCTLTSNMPHKSSWIRKKFKEVKNAENRKYYCLFRGIFRTHRGIKETPKMCFWITEREKERQWFWGL